MAVPKRRVHQQEEIRDVQTFGKWRLPSFRSALTAANIRELTEFARHVVCITADRSSLKRKKHNLSYTFV